jgi:hypothetical protein
MRWTTEVWQTYRDNPKKRERSKARKIFPGEFEIGDGKRDVFFNTLAPMGKAKHKVYKELCNYVCIGSTLLCAEKLPKK